MLALLGSAALACPAWAASVHFRIDPTRTLAEYVVTEFGVFEQRGRFARMSGEVELDRQGASGRIDFRVDANSLDSGWDLRDAFARSEVMLDARRHPNVRFASSRIVYEDGAPARIDGHLSLRGIERAVALSVDRFACAAPPPDAESCEAKVHTVIHRSDFGMTGFAPFLGDDIELTFTVTAVRSDGASAPATLPPAR